jgi:hypothetical protein
VADHVSPPGPVDRRAFADWIYVRTLLENGGPLYHEKTTAADARRDYRNIGAEIDAAAREGRALERIRELVAAGIGPWDDGWEHAAAIAEKEGDVTLAHTIFRSYRPVGRCSMDTRPAEIAREYARFCHRNQKLGCHLQLQIRIMADRFERVAYSSYGEAAASTQAEALGGIGLDTDRFLRGLLVDFASVHVDGASIGLWRLVRAIRESGRAGALEPALRAMASDPHLDEYNRLRATIALAWLPGPDALGRAQVEQRLAGVTLSPVSTTWLETVPR